MKLKIYQLNGIISVSLKWGITLSITEVGDFETLTYPPTETYKSERNNRTGTRPQFWLYCVIGHLF
jgi:hypothetical protein